MGDTSFFFGERQRLAPKALVLIDITLFYCQYLLTTHSVT
jgi:hypothetical protein